MHQCYYHLQIYDDLIFGDLEPCKLRGDKIDLAVKYLEEEFVRCQNIQIVKVKVHKKGSEVISKLNISNAHPLSNKYFLQRDIAFKGDIKELLSKEVLKELSINFNKIDFTVSEVKKSLQSIGVCENSSWNEIDSSRVKYCYYYPLLWRCKKDVQKNLHLKSFEMDDHQFRKLIFNVQKSLVSYLNQLKKLHKIDPKSLSYQLKENYTDQDYISLIYISLIEQLNYLYENYKREFDKTFKVPYYSEKINRNKIDEKIRIVRKHFKERGIDPILTGIIDEQFERIMSFNHPNRLTYHELDYFIKLLNLLSSHLQTFKRITITADDIVSLLISAKFNNFKFIHYFTNEIRKDLKTITDYNLKKLHLLSQKKNVNQSIEIYDMIYDPNSRNPFVVFQEWIDNEMKIVDEYISNKNSNPEINQPETFKVETSLSARELSVFIKTLSDCDIILSKSQSNLARWICANFMNANTDDFSIYQARNNLYNKDPFLLEKVKDLAIQMVNIINEKLAAKE